MSLTTEKCYFQDVCWESSDFQDSEAQNKINGFSPQYSGASLMFEIGFLMEEIEFLVAKEYTFELCSKSESYHFLEFSGCQDSDAINTNRHFSHHKKTLQLEICRC